MPTLLEICENYITEQRFNFDLLTEGHLNLIILSVIANIYWAFTIGKAWYQVGDTLSPLSKHLLNIGKLKLIEIK